MAVLSRIKFAPAVADDISLQQCAFWARFRKICIFLFLIIVLLSTLGGCASCKGRDAGFEENELSESVRKFRPPKNKNDSNCLGLSEKGRQIERNLNAL